MYKKFGFLNFPGKVAILDQSLNIIFKFDMIVKRCGEFVNALFVKYLLPLRCPDVIIYANIKRQNKAYFL